MQQLVKWSLTNSVLIKNHGKREGERKAGEPEPEAVTKLH